MSDCLIKIEKIGTDEDMAIDLSGKEVDYDIACQEIETFYCKGLLSKLLQGKLILIEPEVEEIIVIPKKIYLRSRSLKEDIKNKVVLKNE